ncbi:hydrolase, TatD family, partial [Ostertagia ostertagi]
MMQVSVLEKAEELSPEVSNGHAVDGRCASTAPCESSPVPSVSPSDESPSKKNVYRENDRPLTPRAVCIKKIGNMKSPHLSPSPSNCTSSDDDLFADVQRNDDDNITESAVLPDVEDEDQSKEILTSAFTQNLSWIEEEQIKDPSVLGTSYGCHPHYADQFKDTIRETLVQLLKERGKHKIVAIGECGIDYMRSTVDPEVQKEVFFTQLCLAKDYGLPIIIHCRSGHRGTLDAEASCMEVLDKAEIPSCYPIHRHCFTENWEVAVMWLKR